MKKLIILIIAISLQGCIFAVGAAAGATAVAAVHDHRSIAKILQDQDIANTVTERINGIPGLKQSSHVNVTSFNYIVLLTGETVTPEMRQKAEDAAKTVPEAKRIYNEITIKGATSSLSRASDTWITTKIKTQLVATKDLKSGNIKVVTESGAVYLMGIVTHEQADIAVDIARQVEGVQKVVKIFQYN